MIQEDVPSIHIAPDYGLLEAIDTENQGISVAISGIPKYQVPSVSCVRPITSQPLLLDAARGFRLSNVWKLLFPCALVCVGKPWNCKDFHGWVLSDPGGRCGMSDLKRSPGASHPTLGFLASARPPCGLARKAAKSPGKMAPLGR